MPLLIQLAKRSQSVAFAWIDQNKPRICMLTSGVAALLTSMGIEFVHAPHSLTVSWPDEATLVHGLATFLLSAVLQFAAQHALYDGFWRHVVPSQGARSQEPGVSSSDPVPKF
jgi:hypothetical protein